MGAFFAPCSVSQETTSTYVQDPQGEWNAIAQRYSKGETLSSIVRHYGCTPPAIHYILKRVKSLGHDLFVAGVDELEEQVAAAGVTGR
jgi:hypothetical protein